MTGSTEPARLLWHRRPDATGEPLEGRRITVTGPITGSPDDLADGLAITIDDGSGPSGRSSGRRPWRAGRSQPG